MNKEERREKVGDILSEYRASSEPALCYSELLDELDAIYASDLTASQERVKKLEESLNGTIQIIHSLIASERIINLDEALAYYKTILTSPIKERV